MTVTIEQVHNGYIVHSSSLLWQHKVFHTLEEVCAELLMSFECRSSTMGHTLYGRVTIERNNPDLLVQEERAEEVNDGHS